MGCNCENQIQYYRVVQTINERDLIPCPERALGMLVTVVGADSSYEQFILKGSDPCVNSSWTPYTISPTISLIHDTTESIPVENLPVTNSYLNTRFPGVQKGFMFTVKDMNTTFIKVEDNEWLISNSMPL